MRLEQIYGIIAKEGFTVIALQDIDDYIKDIQNGTEDFPRFNLSEHAGLSKGGAPLIGASIIACYAAASLAASCNAEGREGGPVNDEFLSSFQNSYLLNARMSASRSSILAVGS